MWSTGSPFRWSRSMATSSRSSSTSRGSRPGRRRAEAGGTERGPNPSRLLAVAVGNCLTASLFLLLQRSRLEVKGMKTSVTRLHHRTEKGRLRIGGFAVRIALPEGLTGSALDRCLGLLRGLLRRHRQRASGHPSQRQRWSTAPASQCSPPRAELSPCRASGPLVQLLAQVAWTPTWSIWSSCASSQSMWPPRPEDRLEQLAGTLSATSTASLMARCKPRPRRLGLSVARELRWRRRCRC